MSHYRDFSDYVTEVFRNWIQAEVPLLKLIFETQYGTCKAAFGSKVY